MTIVVTHKPDGTFEVECNGEKVKIEPGGVSTTPITTKPVDPYGGGSPGAMLTIPIDLGRWAAGRGRSRTPLQIHTLVTEFAPRPPQEQHLLLWLPRNASINLGDYRDLIDSLKAEGITLKIVPGE